MQILPQSAISWQLLRKRFYSLKKTFFLRLKGLKNGFEKKFPDLKIFSLILAQNPVFPWFPWLEKVFKIFPDRWEPWFNVWICSCTGKVYLRYVVAWPILLFHQDVCIVTIFYSSTVMWGIFRVNRQIKKNLYQVLKTNDVRLIIIKYTAWHRYLFKNV